MVPHVDHSEHDVDNVVTEQGLADLRELGARERAQRILAHCVQSNLSRCAGRLYERALKRGGHTPHLLEEAFSWHVRARETGAMLPQGLRKSGLRRPK